MKKRPADSVSRASTDWAGVAPWYDELVGDAGSEYHREIILPGVLRLLNLRRGGSRKDAETAAAGGGLCVLDLACGQGVLCRKLARSGCRVAGIDAAAPLIAAAEARNHAEGLAIRYLCADATRLLDPEGNPTAGLSAGGFDAVTVILAIQNITPLSPVWQACRVLLRPGGMLVLVMMHPCFRIPRSSDWHFQKEKDGGIQSRLIRRYLASESIAIQAHPGLAAHGKDASTTVHFHRPLQAYVNTLAGAGLLIDHMEEWPSHKTSQAGPHKAALDRARKEIPMFLAVRARPCGEMPRVQSSSAESQIGRK